MSRRKQLSLVLNEKDISKIVTYSNVVGMVLVIQRDLMLVGKAEESHSTLSDYRRLMVESIE
jgi:hypothetical protein